MFGRLLIGLIAVVAALAQTSAYQSTDSNSSIILNNQAGNVIFNVADTKFTAGFLHEPLGPGVLWGVSLFGKPSANVSSQIFNTTTQQSVGGTVSAGRHVLLSSNPKFHLTDDWWVFQVTYNRTATELVTDADTLPQKRTFDGLKGMLTYNAFTHVEKVTLLFGASAGASKSNNVDQLTPVTVNTPVLQSAAGVTPPFEVDKSSSAYSGGYRTYIGAPIYSDFVVLPHNNRIKWLSLDLFTRSNAAHVNRYVEGGVGLFIAQHEKPTKVLGGITLAWKNGASTLGIVAGWAF
jgi:hypothetical protein